MGEPQTIAGRYRIGREIGAGGMGSVFLGMDVQTEEQVAIKRLNPELTRNDPDIIQRFEREAEALRRLNHPNIVKVFAHTVENDRHYIVMEFVSGGSLADTLEKTPQMPIDRTLNIALDLSDALTRAHRLKIIHRDIKPANVLLAEDGTPRLTDFGVAYMSDGNRVTETGMMVGTLAYLPPEVLSGEKMDERGDIWAFGIMLYEMLAGERPFSADNTGAMLHGILMNPTPDIFEYRDDVPWTLMGLVYWMLEKDPAKRPQSTRLIGAMIENILSGKTLPANWFGDSSGAYDEVKTPTREQARDAVMQHMTGSFRLEDANPPKGTGQQPIPRIATDMITDDLPEKPITLTQKLPMVGEVPKKSPSRILIAAAALLIIVLLAGGALLLSNMPTPDIIIEPVANDENMVLVAQFERVSGEERDVQRFIIEDLRGHLEEDNPEAKIRVREYPAVIRTDEEAHAIGAKYAADVIVWGNYDASRVEAQVQIGDLSLYPLNPYDEATSRRFMDSTMTLSDEREQSLITSVVAVLNLLASVDGDAFSVARNVTVLSTITDPPGTIAGNSAGDKYHRYLRYYIPDIESALAEANQMVQSDASHSLPYVVRALGYARAGNLEEMRQDIATAEQFAPPNFYAPVMMNLTDNFAYTRDYADMLTQVDVMLAAHPDDFYYLSMRGVAHYILGNYDESQAAALRAIEVGAEANFAYAVATAVALRKGDLTTASRLFNEVIQKFPDSSFTERLLKAILNEEAASIGFVPLNAAFGNLTLRRWRDVLNVTDNAIDDDDVLTDIYFLRGFAQCNLGDDAAAEASFSKAIELEPDYTLMYLLRAEVRNNQGNILGAGSDILQVQQSDLAETFAPLLAAGASGDLTCQNFLDFELPE